MSLKLITFSIFDESKKAECIEYIKSFEHIEVAGSSFIINNSQPLDLLRREIAYFTDKADELILVKLRENDFLTFHLGSKRKWIEERL